MSVINIIDLWVNSNIIQIHNPLLTTFMIYVHHVFSPINIISLSLIFLAFLLSRKEWYKSILLTSIVGLSAITELALENIIKRLRPDNKLINLIDFSFPSGHTLIATAFFGFLIYLYRKEITNKFKKNLHTLAGILIIILVGFDRIYLNVHWFSDVIGGLLIGIFWITISVLLIPRIFRFFRLKEKGNSE